MNKIQQVRKICEEPEEHGLTSLRRGGYVETDKQNYRTWVKSYNRVTSKFSNTYFDVKA